MPLTPPPRAALRRRSLFASAAGAALLAGCSGASGSSATGGSPGAADRARARAARDSEALAARYAAVIAAHPQLAARLGPLRAEVVRHAQAFGGGTGPAASPAAGSTGLSGSPSASGSSSASQSPSPSGSSSASRSPTVSEPPSASESPSASASTVPADSEAALADLAAAERALADRRGRALLEVPGELARLMASVAAAGAAHAYLLTEGGK